MIPRLTLASKSLQAETCIGLHWCKAALVEDTVAAAELSDLSFIHPSNLATANGVLRQRNAPLDLKVVSWAPDTLFGDLSSYCFEKVSGDDTYIYIIENGLNPKNSVREHLGR